MCLITFNWQPQSPQPLVMAANRDEFHRRPTRAAQCWSDQPNLLAGQDLEAGGTWMGVTREGRFAALTNVRKLPASYKGTVSRGKLVSDYLTSGMSPEAYLAQIAQHPLQYDGFNLVVGNRTECWYFTNHQDPELGAQVPRRLAPGLYGLSNHVLNTPWPKVEYAKCALADWLVAETTQASELAAQALSQLLRRRETFADEQLPDTGVGLTWERMLSAPFIISPDYGTRAGTGVVLTADALYWAETSYDPQGDVAQHMTAVL